MARLVDLLPDSVRTQYPDADLTPKARKKLQLEIPPEFGERDIPRLRDMVLKRLPRWTIASQSTAAPSGQTFEAYRRFQALTSRAGQFGAGYAEALPSHKETPYVSGADLGVPPAKGFGQKLVRGLGGLAAYATVIPPLVAGAAALGAPTLAAGAIGAGLASAGAAGRWDQRLVRGGLGAAGATGAGAVAGAVGRATVREAFRDAPAFARAAARAGRSVEPGIQKAVATAARNKAVAGAAAGTAAFGAVNPSIEVWYERLTGHDVAPITIQDLVENMAVVGIGSAMGLRRPIRSRAVEEPAVRAPAKQLPAPSAGPPPTVVQPIRPKAAHSEAVGTLRSRLTPDQMKVVMGVGKGLDESERVIVDQGRTAKQGYVERVAAALPENATAAQALQAARDARRAIGGLQPIHEAMKAPPAGSPEQAAAAKAATEKWSGVLVGKTHEIRAADGSVMPVQVQYVAVYPHADARLVVMDPQSGALAAMRFPSERALAEALTYRGATGAPAGKRAPMSEPLPKIQASEEGMALYRKARRAVGGLDETALHDFYRSGKASPEVGAALEELRGYGVKLNDKQLARVAKAQPVGGFVEHFRGRVAAAVEARVGKMGAKGGRGIERVAATERVQGPVPQPPPVKQEAKPSPLTRDVSGVGTGMSRGNAEPPALIRARAILYAKVTAAQLQAQKEGLVGDAWQARVKVLLDRAEPPAPTRTLYRGSGRAAKESAYGEFATGGVFGDDATYYAHTEADAKRYGPKVETLEHAPKNPLVLRTDADFRAAFGPGDVNPIGVAQHRAAKEGLEGDAWANRVRVLVAERAAEMHRAVVERGHDAVVVEMDPRRDDAKRMREVFGHDQTIILREPKAGTAVSPGKTAERKPEVPATIDALIKKADSLRDKAQSLSDRKAPFKEFVAAQKEASAARVAVAEAAAGDAPIVEFTGVGPHESNRLYVLHPIPGGKGWRTTRFEPDGPMGHDEFKTRKEALADLANDGVISGKTAPGRLDEWSKTEKWSTGLERLSEVAKRNRELAKVGAKAEVVRRGAAPLAPAVEAPTKKAAAPTRAARGGKAAAAEPKKPAADIGAVGKEGVEHPPLRDVAIADMLQTTGAARPVVEALRRGAKNEEVNALLQSNVGLGGGSTSGRISAKWTRHTSGVELSYKDEAGKTQKLSGKALIDQIRSGLIAKPAAKPVKATPEQAAKALTKAWDGLAKGEEGKIPIGEMFDAIVRAAVKHELAKQAKKGGAPPQNPIPPEATKKFAEAAKHVVRAEKDAWDRLGVGIEADLAKSLLTVDGLWRHFVTGGGEVLKRNGWAGRVMAKGLEKWNEAADQRGTTLSVNLGRMTKGMTKEQGEAIGHRLNGDVDTTPGVGKATAAIRGTLDALYNEARGLKVREKLADGREVLVRRMDNYFPLKVRHDLRRAILKRGTEAHEKQIAHMMERNAALTRRQAMSDLRNYVNGPSEFTGGGLQHERAFSLHPDLREWDARLVLPPYYMRTTRRIEQARYFGPRNERAFALTQAMAKGGHDGVNASIVFDHTVDPFADPMSRMFKPQLRAVGDFAVLSFLRTAGLAQPFQMLNSIAIMGYTKTIRGIIDVIRDPKAYEEAFATGAPARSVMHEFYPEGAAGGLADKWSHLQGLTPGDTWNRVVTAAGALRYYIEPLVMDFYKNPKNRILRRRIQRLGLDRHEIMAQKGVLNETQRSRAAQRLSNRTQFETTPMSLPPSYNMVYGRLFRIFRAFANQQGVFSKNMVKDAVEVGDWAPVLRYLSTVPIQMIGSEVIRFVNELITGKKKKPTSLQRRLIEDALWIPHFGLWLDLLRAVARGRGSLSEFGAGLALTELYKFSDEAFDAIVPRPDKDRSGLRLHPQRLVRHTLQRMPMMGPRVADWLAPAPGKPSQNPLRAPTAEPERSDW